MIVFLAKCAIKPKEQHLLGCEEYRLHSCIQPSYTCCLRFYPSRSTSQFGKPWRCFGVLLLLGNDGSGSLGVKAVVFHPTPKVPMSLRRVSHGISTCALPSIDSPVNILIASLTKLYDSESMPRILVTIDEVGEIASCDSILSFAVSSIKGRMKSPVIKREFISHLNHDRQ